MKKMEGVNSFGFLEEQQKTNYWKVEYMMEGSHEQVYKICKANKGPLLTLNMILRTATTVPQEEKCLREHLTQVD